MIQKWLDSSLEWLILLARLVSVLAALSFVGLAAAGTVRGQALPWVPLMVQAFAWTGLFGWFGWWLYGNAEWRKQRGQDDS